MLSSAMKAIEKIKALDYGDTLVLTGGVSTFLALKQEAKLSQE